MYFSTFHQKDFTGSFTAILYLFNNIQEKGNVNCTYVNNLYFWHSIQIIFKKKIYIYVKILTAS